MMYITYKDSRTKREVELEWHVGDPLPWLAGNVITFRADGHELSVLIDAIRAAGHPNASTK